MEVEKNSNSENNNKESFQDIQNENKEVLRKHSEFNESNNFEDREKLKELRKNNEVSIDNNPDSKIKNPWKIAALVLGVITVILLIMVFTGKGITGNAITGNVIKGDNAGETIINYLNSKTGGGVEYVSHKDIGNLYEITVSYQGQNIPVFITKDGKYFVQGAIPISGSNTLSQNQPTQQTPKNSPTEETIEVSIDNDAIKGNSNAPITIVEFSDYQCPYCGRFFKNTLPQIISEYVDTGKVKLVFRDFPLSFHENAQKAAESAECAGVQGKYWEMHDKLFKNQNALDVNSLKQYAEDLKLNTAQFNACLDSGEMAEEVKADMNEGQSYGISGTPAFFINGRKLTGAQPFSIFKQIIDEELVKVSG